MRNPYLLILGILSIIIAGCAGTNAAYERAKDNAQPDWQDEVRSLLKVYGHRNWIVVADAAYPAQSNPAIQTITVDASQLETVEFVLGLIEEANHVDATTYLDLELAYVDDGLAPGANDYREQLEMALNQRPVIRLGHEDIIRMLDQSSDLFQVLILKTDLTVPYTSVFFQLECGYWDAEAEAGLRKVMESQMESK